MLHVNVDLYHTTNRTATTNGPISLAQAAGLGKYGYGNGFAVMERISGTVLIALTKTFSSLKEMEENVDFTNKYFRKIP